jgi:hypothetical protein
MHCSCQKRQPLPSFLENWEENPIASRASLLSAGIFFFINKSRPVSVFLRIASCVAI